MLPYLTELWEPTRFALQFLIQVLLLAGLIYLALIYLRGTRAAPILLGLVIVTLLGWVLSQLLGLEVFEWLLSKVPTLLAFAIIIIFQPELRRAFADIGSNPQRLWHHEEYVEKTIEAMVEAAFHLSKKKIGAIIAVQQDIGMRLYADAGVRVQAPVTSELLSTIFYKDTPLHDGAVIINEGVIVAAACFFPLTQQVLSIELGTRHRAALGISEETDAIVIVVSEERGEVSLAHKGRLVRNVDDGRLRRHLSNYLLRKKKPLVRVPFG